MQNQPIACLGWGSLIWDPRDLPIRRGWFDDGPLLPVEFARQSNDDRLTLVINPGSAPVRSLWALMYLDDLRSATEALSVRERTDVENIGQWSSPDDDPGEIPGLRAWASARGVEHVIWTNLSPEGKGRKKEDAVCHLKSLEWRKRERAKEYIRKAPPQIDTDYRRRFESEFGWTPIACDNGCRSD